MADVTVERLETREWERLRAIRLDALRDAPDAFGSTFEQKVGQPDEVWVEQARNLPTWVAAQAGEDVGMVRVAPASNAPKEASLISM